MINKINLNTKLTITGLVIGLIMLIYFVHDRYFQGKLVIELSEEKIVVVPIHGKTNYDGALSIVLYDVKIKNLTNRTKTIKHVKLKYILDNKEYIIDSNILHKETFRETRDELIIANSTNDTRIIYYKWVNLISEINKFEPIPPEGILAGSALYILRDCKMDDYCKIENVEFIIIDSKDKIYKQKFPIEDLYSKAFSKGYYVEY